MHLTYTPPIQLTRGTNHHAFTSCAFWRGQTYVAYREADTHHPFPLGRIQIQQQSPTDAANWSTVTFWETAIDGDLRDPRLIATPDALYCLIGAYLPKYPNTTVSIRSSDNLIQSFLTYTEDGHFWAPLRPIFRPNYWIWSALPLAEFWVAAAYHCGGPGEPSSIHLLFGSDLLHLKPNGVIYDGSNLERDPAVTPHRYLYPHTTVAEPVLYSPTPDTLACAVRTEDGTKHMAIGCARFPYHNWHWWETSRLIHPSAVLATPSGLLLAGREMYKTRTTWDICTALYHLDAQYLTRLAILPSAYDTGYAGLCPTEHPNQFLCSYYSQHATPAPYGTPLPGAHVFTTDVTILP